MKTVINKKALLVAVLSSTLVLPAVSNAAVNPNQIETESATLKISDLDLSQEKGIVTLYERLKSTADMVCGSKDNEFTGSRVEANKYRRDYKRCYARALNGAVNSIKNEKLTEFHKNNS